MPNPKILFFTRPLTPPWDEGSKNLAFEIARHSEGNFTFCLLTDRSGKLAQENWPTNQKIVFEPIFSSGKFDFQAKLVLIKKLFLLDPNKLDLIHFLFAPRPLTSQIFRWKFKNTQIKTIQTLATLNQLEKYPPKKIRQILFADLVIAQSRYTWQKLKQTAIPAKMIYPGINLNKFTSTPKDKKLLTELKIKEKDFVLLFAGEYDRLEAIDDILEAFKILKKKKATTDLKLILACRLKTKKDKKIKQKTQKIIQKNNWQNNFIFLDFAQNMVKLYNLADLNIFPVRKMAGKFDVPLVLIEAMACGKTVLVSGLPVLTEIIQDNKNGAVVPAADPTALAEKIFWLKNNPSINQALAVAGQKTAFQLFDIQKTAKQYQQIYAELLKK